MTAKLPAFSDARTTYQDRRGTKKFTKGTPLLEKPVQKLEYNYYYYCFPLLIHPPSWKKTEIEEDELALVETKLYDLKTN